MLADPVAVGDFYRYGSVLSRRVARVDRVIGYVHSPQHMFAAVGTGTLDGVAAQYNIAEPWPALYIDEVHDAGLEFVGMSPLRRGRLPRASMSATMALCWAAAHPRVATLVVTLSTSAHVRTAFAAVADPLPERAARNVARRWAARASPKDTPQDVARWSRR